MECFENIIEEIDIVSKIAIRFFKIWYPSDKQVQKVVKMSGWRSKEWIQLLIQFIPGNTGSFFNPLEIVYPHSSQ